MLIFADAKTIHSRLCQDCTTTPQPYKEEHQIQMDWEAHRSPLKTQKSNYHWTGPSITQPKPTIWTRNGCIVHSYWGHPLSERTPSRQHNWCRRIWSTQRKTTSGWIPLISTITSRMQLPDLRLWIPRSHLRAMTLVISVDKHTRTKTSPGVHRPHESPILLRSTQNPSPSTQLEQGVCGLQY